MMLVERRSAVDAFYWAVTTVTTVGYGDITPETDGGRLFVLLFVTCAVATLAWAGTTLVEVAVVATSEATAAKAFAAARITPEVLAKAGGDKGYVTEMDFMKATLVQLGKCDERDFRIIEESFAELAPAGTGPFRGGSRRRRQSARRRPRARAQGERKREKGGEGVGVEDDGSPRVVRRVAR